MWQGQVPHSGYPSYTLPSVDPRGSRHPIAQSSQGETSSDNTWGQWLQPPNLEAYPAESANTTYNNDRRWSVPSFEAPPEGITSGYHTPNSCIEQLASDNRMMNDPFEGSYPDLFQQEQSSPGLFKVPGFNAEVGNKSIASSSKSRPSTSRQPASKGKERKIAKATSKNQSEKFACSQCTVVVSQKEDLIRHVQSRHIRPFRCILQIYGCTASFGTKNEWKRHINTLHLRTGYWRCDLEPCRSAETDQGRKKNFGRKDLFTQHIKRIHRPAVATGTKQELELSRLVGNMVQSCYHHVRDLPSEAICGYCCADGNIVDRIFSGPSAWDQKMEHIGQHLELSGQHSNECIEDPYLKQWLIEDGALEEDENGAFVLTAST